MSRWIWLMLPLTGCLDYTIEATDQAAQEPLTESESDSVIIDESEDTEDTEDTDHTESGNDDGYVAEAPVYANTSDTLYEVEPSDGTLTRIGQFTEAGTVVSGMVDIAIDVDGHMFGGTFDALYSIDPSTGRVLEICEIDVSMYALAFTSDGRLFAGGDSTIHEIDLDDCSTEEFVKDSVYDTSGDLVGLPDGYLYWTVEGSDGDGLVRVDPSSGSTSWIGSIGTEKLFGLGYDEAEGALYGFSSDGFIVAIAPSNANAIVLDEDADFSWWGATTNPVVW